MQSLDLWVIVRIVGNRWIYENQYRKHTEPSPVLCYVIVGITDKGEAVFYDIVDMKPTSFEFKKEESPTTATTQNAIGDIQGDSSTGTIEQNAENVNKKLSLSDDVGANVPVGGISGKDVELQEKADSAKDTPQYTEGEKKLFAIVDAIRNGTDPKAAIEAVTAEQPVDIRTVKKRNDAKRQNNAGVEIKLIKELAE